jgi:hypothetical protein
VVTEESSSKGWATIVRGAVLAAVGLSGLVVLVAFWFFFWVLGTKIGRGGLGNGALPFYVAPIVEAGSILAACAWVAARRSLGAAVKLLAAATWGWAAANVFSLLFVINVY